MPDKWGRYPGDPSYGIDPNGGSGGGTDPNSKYFGGGMPSSPTDVNNLLRQRGYNIPYSSADLYGLIGQLLSRGDPSYHTGAPMSEVGSLNDPNAPGDTFSQTLDKLVGLLSGRRAGAGPTTGINDKQAWSAYSQDATGPAPSEEYQNVFADNFKTEAQGGSANPFDQFVQKQEPYLQKQYLAQAYQKFSQPGVMDNIKDAYNQLQGKANRASAAAANGEDQGQNVVPSFEDYIKGQVSNDYTNFLQQQKSGLATAFEMASPLERYGYHQSKALEGASAPRIL